MQAPGARYILTRAIFLLAALVALMYGWTFLKKHQRKSAIVSELKSLCSDSSYFQQFYAEDAKKSLVRAVGLLVEANKLGMPPEKAIDEGLGLKAKIFADDSDREETPPKIKIVQTSLRANYENVLKLGYKADMMTLSEMRLGELPTIPSGPEEGKKPVIGTLIDPALSPGIEKVLANLEIRPPSAEGQAPTDIQIAMAKKLARDLAYAGVIEDKVRDKIETTLSPPAPKK